MREIFDCVPWRWMARVTVVYLITAACVKLVLLLIDDSRFGILFAGKQLCITLPLPSTKLVLLGEIFARLTTLGDIISLSVSFFDFVYERGELLVVRLLFSTWQTSSLLTLISITAFVLAAT